MVGSERWGDLETMSTKVQQRRLEWLGHLARMSDNRMPKIALLAGYNNTSSMLGPKEEIERCHQKRFGSFQEPTRYTMYMVHVQSNSE